MVYLEALKDHLYDGAFVRLSSNVYREYKMLKAGWTMEQKEYHPVLYDHKVPA